MRFFPDAKLKDWSLAIGYVLFIYATLDVVRVPTNYLRAHGLLRLTLGIVFCACFLSLIFYTLFHKGHWLRLFGVGLTFSIYFLIARKVTQPEEQIHFLEYGLVGVFFLRAFHHHFKSEWKILLMAFLLGTAAGVLDEILQGFLPSRHFDAKDIVLNALSVALGLLIFSILPKPRRQPSSVSISY